MAGIAVIGAGMGSLAAAARLATAGHRVTVYERSATYGGGVARFERDGFGFDTGPGLLHLPAVYRDLFIKTGKGGKEPLEQCVSLTQVDPASRHVFADGTSVSLPNASRGGVAAALDAALGPGAGERWNGLLGRAREVWEATRRPLLEDALAQDVSPLGRDPYPALRRPLRRRPTTLAEVGRRELRDPRLAALLGSYAQAYGFDPATVPASAAVLPYMEQTFGTWYVGGGMRALADAVYERCLARGVEFRFGAEVSGEVLEKAGRAAGVELADGTRVEADAVVSGVPPREHDGTGTGTGTETGRLVVCLALRGARGADAVHRTVVHDERHVVTVLRPDDPALRPDEGHEAVTLTVTVPAPSPAPVDADRLLALVEAAVPELRLGERLLWRELRPSPGPVSRPALAGAGGAFLHPANRSPLPGLYRVGGWSHPGGGLAHTGMSAAIVADLIAGGPGGSR
jgi:phytoene dehydrogenase-like protein